MKYLKFSPLFFLASLGAGGIAILPFVIMQYTTTHGPGLVTMAQIASMGYTGFSAAYFTSLEVIMAIFAVLHFVLTGWFTVNAIKWIKNGHLKGLLKDPLNNATVLAPFISILMTMNLFIGPIRYFFPLLSDNFQSLFLPAMIFWSMLFVVIILLEVYLLGVSFKKGFDIDKINFGWLLHPFLLGMLTVIGTGLAAMSKNAEIAHTAAFMSLISGSMGVFLLLVKMIMLFKNHFAASNLPEKHFLPSFLIVIPNITLFAISAFRLGHYLEFHHHFHLDAYFYIVIGVSFAFEIWYMLFGISLLVNYFRQNHFKEYYITQWGLICPFVAFITLGSFAYKVVAPSSLLYGVMIAALVVTIIFFVELLIKHLRVKAIEY